jgi:hypothetical protein
MRTKEAEQLVDRVQSVLGETSVTTRKMFGGTTFLLD